MPQLTSDLHIHAFLRENEYTSGLPPRIVNLLAELANGVHFADGEYLFRQGDYAVYIYLVRRGTLWLQSKSPEYSVHIWIIAEGGLVGWSCMTPPFRYLLDARAIGDVDTVRLDANELRNLIPRDHELGYHLFQILLIAASERLMPANAALHQRSLP